MFRMQRKLVCVLLSLCIMMTTIIVPNTAYAEGSGQYDGFSDQSIYTEGDPNHLIGETVKVIVKDISNNNDSIVVNISGTVNVSGAAITLNEDAANEGIFIGEVKLVSAGNDNSSVTPVEIGVIPGQDISFSYVTSANDTVNTNIYVAAEQVAKVTASPAPSGTTLASGTEITLSSATTGSAIYYSIGMDSYPSKYPDSGSTLYTEDTKPVINGDITVIKAVAVRDGFANSEISTFTYITAASGYLTGKLLGASGQVSPGADVQIQWSKDGEWWGKGAVIDETGFFYFPLAGLEKGAGDYTINCFPAEDSPDSCTKVDFNWDGAKNPTPAGGYTINLAQTQIKGTLGIGIGSTGLVKILDDQEKMLSSVPILRDGSFNIGGLLPNINYKIEAQPNWEYDYFNSEITDVTSAIGTITLDLKAPQINATALGTDATALKADTYNVLIRALDGRWSNFENNSKSRDGKFIVGNLEPGIYGITIIPNNSSLYSQAIQKRITIAEDGTVSEETISLQFTAPKLTGSVKDSAGQPLSDAIVEVFSKDHEYITYANVDSSGNYGIGGIPDGDYYIRIKTKDDAKSSAMTAVNIKEATPLSNIDLQLIDGKPMLDSISSINEGQDGLYIRLMNVSKIASLEDFSIEVIDSNGNSLTPPMTFNGNNLGLENVDEYQDKADLRVNVPNGINLSPGLYKLKILYNGEALPQIWPDSDKLYVIWMLGVTPGYIEDNYTTQTVTLGIKDSSMAPWVAGADNINVILNNSNGSFTINSSEVTVLEDEISFSLPAELSGIYWIDVFSGKERIANSLLNIGSKEVQLEANINDNQVGPSAIPYSRIILEKPDPRDSNNNLRFEYEAGKDGHVVVSDLEPGTYNMWASGSLYGKYIDSKHEILVVDLDGTAKINDVTVTAALMYNLATANSIIGTVSLLAGKVAPTGGLEVYVMATTENGTPENKDDDLQFGAEAFVKEGQSSAEYKLLIPKDGKEYYINYWTNGNGTNLINSAYFSYDIVTGSGTTVFTKNSVKTFQSQDLEGISIVLAEGAKISGTLTLPAGTVNTDGIGIYIQARKEGNTNDENDDILIGSEANILAGNIKAEYTIVVPKGAGYVVYYGVDTGKYTTFEPVGFYSSTGTVYDYNQAAAIDVSVSDKTDINLNVSVPIAFTITIKPYNTDPTNKPVVVYATTNRGYLNTRGYVFESNGEFTFKVTDDAGNVVAEKEVKITNIDTTPPTVLISGCNSIENEELGVTPVITFSDDCVVASKAMTLNGRAYDGSPIKAAGKYVITASAKDEAGNVASAVSEQFEIKWDMTAPIIDIVNINNNSIITTDITPTIKVQGGSNLSKYTYTAKLKKPDGTIVEFAKNSIPTLNVEGTYRLEILAVNPSYTDITSSKVLDFTIDKSNPTVSISGVSNGALYNSAVTPIITLADSVASQQLLTGNASIILSKDNIAVAYTLGNTITADGAYTLNVKTQDAAGNVSGTTTVSFTIDRTKPVITLSGALNGYTYKDTNVTLSVKSNEATLTVLSNGEEITLANNQYVFTGIEGQSVDYKLAIKSMDAAGNVSEQQLAFTIDRQAVNIIVSGVTEGQVLNYYPDVSFTTYEGETEKQGTRSTIDGTAFAGGKYSVEGSHTLLVSYLSGTNTYTKTIHFVIDKTAPVLNNAEVSKNGTAVAAGRVYAKTGDIIKIKASATEINGIDEVYFSVGSAAAKVAMKYVSGYYEGEHKVESGNYTDVNLIVTAKDKAGNTSNKIYTDTITIDNTKPSVSIATTPTGADGNNGMFKATDMSLTITAGSTDKIIFYQNGTAGNAIGSKSITPIQGANSIICYAQDAAGNKSDEKVLVFEYDSSKPSNVSLVSTATSGLTNIEAFTINGNVAGEGGKSGSVVVLMKNGNIVGKANIKADSTFEMSDVKLAEGTNDFTLTAIDRAGNESAVATTISRTLDSTAPVVVVDKTNDTTYTVTVNENVATGITAKFNDVAVAAENITSTQPKQFKVTVSEQVNGTNSLKVFATDSAGNVGNGSYTSTYIPAIGQDNVPVTENATVDVPSTAFANEVQMLVKTVDAQSNIEYKTIGAPISFEFKDSNGDSIEPSIPLIIKNYIGTGLTGVMLMHIDGSTITSIPVAVTTKDKFVINDLQNSNAVYISDTGWLVLKTNDFSAYQVAQDNTAPVITIANTDFDLNSSDYAVGSILSGTLTDNDTKAKVSEVSIDGVLLELDTLSEQQKDSTFEIPLALTDGTHEVVLKSTDLAGNTSTVSKTFRVDKTAPTLGATAEIALTNRNTADISINTSENSEIKINGVSQGWYNGSAVIPVGLNEGSNTLTVSATDATGNTVVASVISIVKDSTPPTINITGVNNGDTYGGARTIGVDISGQASGSITLDGEAYTPGNYNTSGQHTMTVSATDEAGNMAEKSITFTIDTSVPTITVSGAESGLTYTASKIIAINANNADELIVTKSIDGGEAVNVESSSPLEATVDCNVADGEQHSYVVKITAKKKNPIRIASTTISFSIDKKAPVITNTTATQTQQATINITGSVDELSNIFLNGDLVIANAQPGEFTISGRTVIIGANSFVIKAIDVAGHESSKTILVERIAPQTDPGTGGVSTGGGSSIAIISTAEVKVSGNTIQQKPVLQGSEAKTDISESDITKAFSSAVKDALGVQTIKVEIAEIAGAKQYTQGISSSVMKNGSANQKFEISTPYGMITIAGNMFLQKSVSDSLSVAISIGKVDNTGLSKELQAQIGNRPVINLKASVDGKAFEWINPSAPVTIAFKYTPTAEELKNPDGIIVYYIDGNNNLIPVPSGRYDAKTGKVTFTTTHFSKYAVAYTEKLFKDVSKQYWAQKAINALTAKGIADGMTENEFSPKLAITREECIAWLVRALGITAETVGNFDDVSDSKYSKEIAIAKALGITGGVGNNKFAPKKSITRQELMTMTVKALNIANKSLEDGTKADIAKYADVSKVSKYAIESVATLVKSGIISGSGNNINPKGLTTRAEAAVIMYKLYNR